MVCMAPQHSPVRLYAAANCVQNFYPLLAEHCFDFGDALLCLGGMGTDRITQNKHSFKIWCAGYCFHMLVSYLTRLHARSVITKNGTMQVCKLSTLSALSSEKVCAG
jgi:hypothetical protein